MPVPIDTPEVCPAAPPEPEPTDVCDKSSCSAKSNSAGSAKSGGSGGSNKDDKDDKEKSDGSVKSGGSGDSNENGGKIDSGDSVSQGSVKEPKQKGKKPFKFGSSEDLLEVQSMADYEALVTGEVEQWHLQAELEVEELWDEKNAKANREL